MPVSLEQWWARRQRVTNLEVPYPVGRYSDDWGPYPVLVEQFRPDRNGELGLSQIPPAADVWVLWVCSLGHEFVATPAEQRARPGRTRSNRSWCPVCSAPSLLPSTPRWPRPPGVSIRPLISANPHETNLHNSGVAVANMRFRMPARRVGPPIATATPELWRSAADVRPGEAFCSERAPRATSAAQGRLRHLITERLDIDVSATAVRVRTPFFNRLEVWPDVIMPELAIAIELDTVGRNGDEHVGRRERSDRRKDTLLREVGWEVIRLRTRPLRPLGPHDLVIASVSHSVVTALVERVAEVRGELIVRAYLRERGVIETAPTVERRTLQ